MIDDLDLTVFSADLGSSQKEGGKGTIMGDNPDKCKERSLLSSVAQNSRHQYANDGRQLWKVRPVTLSEATNLLKLLV
jgi:hypothetical protein